MGAKGWSEAGAKILDRNHVGGVAAAVMLGVSACGGSVATAGGHAPDATMAADVQEASTDAPADGAADAGDPCSSPYPPDSSATLVSCCNGQLCRGECTPDGGCDCFGIAGGCWEGTACCKLHFACTGAKSCR